MTAKELDQFYTNPDVAQECFDKLKNLLDSGAISGYRNKGVQWIEPSAGTGAFFNLFPRNRIKGLNGKKVKQNLGFDIDPKAAGVKYADFLSQEINDDEMISYERRVILGNPPFGNRSALAIDFFNRGADWAPTIAFIIPIQFRKWSVQSKLHAGFKLVVDDDLPENAFIFKDKPYHVKCVFQVWTMKNTMLPDLRIKVKPQTTHSEFDMWQYNNTKAARKVFLNDFDFAVLRQGYGDYTTLVHSAKDCDLRKQWILFKAHSAKTLDRLKRLDFQKLSGKNTTVPGFGKADVVAEYISLYGEETDLLTF